MLALPLAVSLLAAAPVQVAVPDFHITGGKPGQAAVLMDPFVAELSRRGFQVTTQRDIAAMLGIERQKQLLGCADASSSCLTELAGALGSDALVSATLTQTGDAWFGTVTALDSRGRSLSTLALRAASSAELLESLRRAAGELAADLARAFPGRVAEAGGRRHLTAPAIGVGAVALVLLGVGGGLFGEAHAIDSRLRSNAGSLRDAAELESAISRGRTFQTIGLVGLGVGGAALVTAVVLAIIGAPEEPKASVQLAVTPGGVHAGVTLVWP